MVCLTKNDGILNIYAFAASICRSQSHGNKKANKKNIATPPCIRRIGHVIDVPDPALVAAIPPNPPAKSKAQPARDNQAAIAPPVLCGLHPSPFTKKQGIPSITPKHALTNDTIRGVDHSVPGGGRTTDDIQAVK